VNDFVQKLEKIEPPNQLVAVIGDPLLQKFLQLRSSDEYSHRVDRWLMAFFEDQLQIAEHAESKILEMLDVIREYAQYTKVCVASHILPSLLNVPRNYRRLV
jgi:centromere protein I